MTEVKNFIMSLVKNEEDARDLSQDIFLKIWNNREAPRNSIFQNILIPEITPKMRSSIFLRRMHSLMITSEGIK